MQKLLLHDRTDWSYKLHMLGGIVTFEQKNEKIRC